MLTTKPNPFRLMWDGTDIQPDEACRYIQFLEASETAFVLSPLTLEIYRKVSLLRPNYLSALQSTEQVLAQLALLGIDLDEIINQLTI